MSELKTKQVFDEPLKTSFDEPDKSEVTPDLGAQKLFTVQEKFVPVAPQVETDLDGEAEQQLEQVIRPSKKKKWFGTGLLIAFSGLVGWQAIDSVITAIQTADWLALGWAGFIAAIASLGLGAIDPPTKCALKLAAHRPSHRFPPGHNVCRLPRSKHGCAILMRSMRGIFWGCANLMGSTRTPVLPITAT